jgi:hypothetical protein
LSLEIWFDRDPFYGEPDPMVMGAPKAAPVPELKKVMTDEMVWIFSGMIYGWEFEYTIEDPSQGIDRIFILKPRALINPKDKDLDVYQNYLVGKREFIKAELKLDDYEKRNREAALSMVYTPSTAIGVWSYFDGSEGKIKAYEDGVREAILVSLKKSLGTRPRKAEGIVYLMECPLSGVIDGEYRSTVRIRFGLETLDKKGVF